MISYQYTITNRSGESITLNDHTTDPNNLYALQTYPKFSRNVKNTEIERIGQNNYWDFYSYYGKMTVAFNGVIVTEDHQTLEDMKTQMIKVLALPIVSNEIQDGYVTITWTDDNGIEKTVEAKIVADILFDRRLAKRTVMDFQIQLKTRRNYIEDTDGYTGMVSGHRGFYGVGFLLPTGSPLTMTAGYYDVLTITPTGSGGALPKIKLYGEDQQLITNPRVYSITTGETFQLDYTLNGSAEWIEIDTENGTVVDHLGNDVSGYINLSAGFIHLIAGANQLVYLSDEDPFISGIMPETGTRFTVEYKRIYAS